MTAISEVDGDVAGDVAGVVAGADLADDVTGVVAAAGVVCPGGWVEFAGPGAKTSANVAPTAAAATPAAAIASSQRPEERRPGTVPGSGPLGGAVEPTG